jgi:hypothetical protein
MLNIKPEFWTKSGGERFVVLSLRDFERVQEAIEDAGLAKLMRRAKAEDRGAAGTSLAEMKRLLGMTRGKGKRRGGVGSRLGV